MKAKLTVIRGRKRGASLWLMPRDKIDLGREKNCAWELADPKVSRLHCEIKMEQGQFWVEDKNSSNGTYVNGHRIVKVALQHRDIIRIGITSMLFEIAQTTPNREIEEFIPLDPNQARTSGETIRMHRPENQMFAHYRIEYELGRGGMGIVYKAYDTKLERTIALKLLAVDRGTYQDRIKRFVLEAKAAARIKHPNIVSIFEVGDNPQHYFTMEYIEGDTLSQRIKESRIAPLQAATIFQKVAWALAVVHEAGIIHRDIKPSNIMILDEGHPKIMDFGLAKVIDQSISSPGRMIGTPAYISPEQAEGKVITPASDIYSLGATLYETLTGRPPFQGDSYYNVLYQVLDNDPITPRALNPDIAIDLEAICLKCLEKSPGKRYSSGRELAKDFENFLHNRRVSAKPATKLTYAKKFIIRHRVWCGAIAFLVCLICFSTAIYITLEKQKLIAVQTKLAESLVAQGDSLGLTGRWHEARSLYREAGKIFQKIKRSPFLAELGIWDSYRHAPSALNTFVGHSSPVLSAVFSPQGWRIISGSADKTIKVWDMATGCCLQTLKGHAHRVMSVAVSANGFYILSGSADHTLKLWELKSGRLIRTFTGHKGSVNAVAFSPAGSWIISGSDDKTLKLWETESGRLIRTFSGHSDTISAVDFSHDCRHVVSTSWDRTVKLWDLTTGKNIRSFEGHKDVVRSVVFSHNDQFLLSSGWDKTVRLWSVASGKEVRPFIGHKGMIYSAAFSPDSKFAISGGSDNQMRLWDVKTGRELRVFPEHAGTIRCVTFSEDGRLAISASDDGSLRLWDVAVEWEPCAFYGHSGGVTSVDLSDDRVLAISGGEDNSVKVWDVATGYVLHNFTRHRKNVNSVELSHDSSLAVSGSDDGTARLWDIETGKNVHSFQLDGAVTRVSFAPNEKSIAVASSTGHVAVFDIVSKQRIHHFTIPEQAAVYSVKFSPDGKLLAAASANHRLYLWKLRSGELLRTYDGHKGAILDIAFSPDGQNILSGSWDQTLILWDIETGAQVRVFARHSEAITSVAFSPDGRLALTGSRDKSIRLWDIESGRELRSFTLHNDWVRAAVFSSDSSKVLSGSQDGTLKLWDFSRPTYYRKLENKVNEARKILKNNRDDAAALTVLGRWYFLRGIWKEARLCFLKARRRGEKGISALTMAYCYWKNNDLATAGYQFNVAQQNGEAATGYLNLCLQAVNRQKSSFIVPDNNNRHPFKKIAVANRVDSVAFSPDGRLAVAGNRGHTLELWEVSSGKLLRTFSGHADVIICVAFSPDGRYLLSGGWDKTVRLWEVASGKQLKLLRGHTDDVLCVTFSPNGRLAFSSSSDRTMRLWNLAEGRLLKVFTGHNEDVFGVDFSPDGRMAVSGSWDHNLKIWDVASGKCLRTLIGHTRPVLRVAFSPDGQYVASAGWDDSVKLWRADSGNEIRAFLGHSDHILTVIFSPDGRMLLSTSHDKTLKLWNATDGCEICTLVGHQDMVVGADISYDGRMAISGSWDKTVAFWSLPPPPSRK